MKPYHWYTGLSPYTNLQESPLYQLVDCAARGGSILDLVLAKLANLVCDVMVGEEFSISDHHMVSFNIKFSDDNVTARYEKLHHKKVGFQKFKEEIGSNDWNPIVRIVDINGVWKLLTNILSKEVKLYITMHNRWSTKNIKHKW